jgi:hypothetical protein
MRTASTASTESIDDHFEHKEGDVHEEQWGGWSTGTYTLARACVTYESCDV